MNETNIVRTCALAASRIGARLFRQNVAQGWMGKSTKFTKRQTVEVMPGDVLIRQGRPLHAGLCVGSSDLIGWTGDGRFLAVEVKTDRGVVSDEQEAFISAVRLFGGRAGIARHENDIQAILSGEIRD